MAHCNYNGPIGSAAPSGTCEAPCSLILGDCLEVMKNLPDKSVDAIITDLPYGTTACKWDAVIPFAPMWEQVRRVLKVNGVFVTTASQPFTSLLVASNLDAFRYEWVWKKNLPTGFATAKHQPMKAHESILIFGHGKLCYNPQPTETNIRDRKLSGSNGIRAKAKAGSVYGSLQTVQSEIILKKLVSPRSVIDVPCVPRATGTLHPTQKPLELMRYMVRTYTNPGDVVLDPCMGSGTTCLAAKLEGRGYIGIEREPKYFGTAKTRIEGDTDLFSANAQISGGTPSAEADCSALRRCKDCVEMPDDGTCDKCGDSILTTKDAFVPNSVLCVKTVCEETANKELSPSSTVSPKDTDALLATIRKHVEKIPCHDCRSVPCWYCELKRLVIDKKVEAPK